MLRAVLQKKTRYHRRYSNMRYQQDGERKTKEDEITSIVFGPLTYMPAAEMSAFWKILLRSFSQVADTDFDEGSIEFWPRLGDIEPDMLVHLKCTKKNLAVTILVELKWESPLSGDDQLVRQWDELKRSQYRADDCYHIFIGKKKEQADKEVAAHGNPWNGRLVSFSWVQILALLKTSISENTDSAYQLWTREILAFFPHVGVWPFRGFGDIGGVARFINASSTLFWKGPRFFQCEAYPSPPRINSEHDIQTLFWREK